MAFLGNMWKEMRAQGIFLMGSKVKIKEESRKSITFLGGYFLNF